MSLHQLLSYIEQRPSMFIDPVSLDSLYNCIRGFLMEKDFSDKVCEDDPAFDLFHHWVITKLGPDINLAYNWHKILKQKFHNEEQRLKVFFDLYNSFSKIKGVSYSLGVVGNHGEPKVIDYREDNIGLILIYERRYHFDDLESMQDYVKNNSYFDFEFDFQKLLQS